MYRGILFSCLEFNKIVDENASVHLYHECIDVSCLEFNFQSLSLTFQTLRTFSLYVYLLGGPHLQK